MAGGGATRIRYCQCLIVGCQITQTFIVIVVNNIYLMVDTDHFTHIIIMKVAY